MTNKTKAAVIVAVTVIAGPVLATGTVRADDLVRMTLFADQLARAAPDMDVSIDPSHRTIRIGLYARADAQPVASALCAMAHRRFPLDGEPWTIQTLAIGGDLTPGVHAGKMPIVVAGSCQAK